MAENLVVKGAREHNLKSVDIELPRDKLIVFTGISGSGKSSLAFDTIYAEGQRRYVESLSAYARQFLGQMDKPDVDFIEGLSPAISIDQKSASRNPRSTVGTITEVYDYLRLLFARVGVPHDPETGEKLVRQTPQQIVDRVMKFNDEERFQILAPVVRGRKGTYDTLVTDLAGQGFTRAIIDGEMINLNDVAGTNEDGTPVLQLERYEMHDISVIVDRLVMRDGINRRLTDSIEFPYLLLLVSGGHTQLLAVAGPGRYHRYGTTMDDAAGEAFDKCAKIMGLGYPGGPAIEKAARQGDAGAIALPRPLSGTDHCHFSFSGLKTALANRLKQLGGVEQAPLHNLAASLQAAIADCLTDRSQRAMRQFATDYLANLPDTQPVLVIAGGVAANKYIFVQLADTAAKNGFRLSVPPAALCTDNAAMIAWAALERHYQDASDSDDFNFSPRPRWPLDGNAAPPPGRGVRA